MDLVKCAGAAVYHDQDFYLLGIVHDESQMLVKWLLENLQDSTGITTESLWRNQRKILWISSACKMQDMEIIDNVGFECDGNGYFHSSIELPNSDFVLENAISAVLGLAMPLIREKNLLFLEQITEDVKAVNLHAAQARDQQVLADFLMIMVQHADHSDCWVRTDASRLMDCGSSVAHLQF